MLLFLKNLVFTVLVPGTVAGWGPYWVLTGRSRALPAPHGWQAIAGAIAGALGVSFYLWCLWDFAVTGRGTPAPVDPPRHLVVRGLYRYVRNPMYVGVLTVIAGWALLFRSVAVLEYAAAVAVGFHLLVLGIEEPMLRAKFGAAYEEYCRRVSRWLPHATRLAPP